MLAWSGFGLKDHRTEQTTLLKMVEEGVRLHPAVTLRENTRDGVSPNFQAAGFIRPDQVTLIEAGAFHDCLVSPRSAKEYDVPTNGASNAGLRSQSRWPRAIWLATRYCSGSTLGYTSIIYGTSTIQTARPAVLRG